VIILEGCDLSGKTTLANKLSAHYHDLPIRKFSVPDGDPTPDYVKELNHATFPKIYDRFLYGEYVYSRVKNRNVYMGKFELQMLELMLVTRPHLIVYCKPPWDEVARRYAERGDEYVNLVELSEIYEMYDEILTNPLANVIVYDGNNEGEVLMRCKQAMDEVNWAFYNSFKKNGFPGIGKLNPKYMFIGERYNYRAQHQVTFWSKAGEYLMEQIAKTGVDIKDCHFANSIDDRVKKITPLHIMLVNPEYVVCLGAVAWNIVRFHMNALADHDIKVRQIPHPAYWSRFRSGEEDEYIKGIKLSCGL